MDDSYHVVAHLYDFIVDYRNRPDVPFFVDFAAESPGPVLELGCGTGRVLIPSARTGAEIVGVDLSAEMLDVCQQNLDRESNDIQSRVRLVQADLRSFQISQKFALITIPFRPFQHLVGVEDQLACLDQIHRHLDDDGRLVLDVFNPSLTVLISENVGEEVEGPDFTLPDGRYVEQKARVTERDRITQVLSIEMIFTVKHVDGRTDRVVHPFKMRYFFRYEMEHLLARTGFTVEALYGDYQKNPFSTSYSNDLVFVARKRI